MDHTTEIHELQDGEPPEMRAVPEFDDETGRLTGVTLTTKPPREGASIGVRTERLDLDAAVPPLPGWHWFEDRGDIVCELAPTTQEVLAQIAEDMFQGTLGSYRLNGCSEPVDQLRGIATRRLSLPSDEARFQCVRILREYQDHLRKIEVGDEI